MRASPYVLEEVLEIIDSKAELALEKLNVLGEKYPKDDDLKQVLALAENFEENKARIKERLKDMIHWGKLESAAGTRLGFKDYRGKERSRKFRGK
jgi:hypothetical protein